MSRRWLSVFEPDSPRLVGDLERLVRLESPADDPDRVSDAARWVRDRLREGGVSAELRPCPPRGDALLASVVFREGGTLLLGHLDTVWPVGTLAGMPWRLDAGRASGPGVFDMKAGAVTGMAVLTAMVREEHPNPVSLLLVPDEEAGSEASRDLTLSVARRHPPLAHPVKDPARGVRDPIRLVGRALETNEPLEVPDQAREVRFEHREPAARHGRQS